MTPSTIEHHVEVIKKATEIAAKSKETALKFLIDAGIISPNEVPVNKPEKKQK